jgi:hypothetical protein
MIFSVKKAVLPVFIIITGLSVLFCGCDLTASPAVYYIEEHDRWYVKEDNNYSEEKWQECQDVLNKLSEFGITLPERFSTLQDAQYIAEQRANLKDGNISRDRPVTVTMYPFFDYGSRPLSARQNGLSEIINRPEPEQQVLYFQIGNDDDFKEALRLLKDNLPAEKKFVLILAGHGNEEWLDWDYGPVSVRLDPTDYEDPKLINLLRSLPIELAVFHSCAAGKGGAGKKNQANRLAEHIRIGGKVIAPLSEVYGIVCVFDSGNNIKDIKYNTLNSKSELTESAKGAYYAAGKY